MTPNERLATLSARLRRGEFGNIKFDLSCWFDTEPEYLDHAPSHVAEQALAGNNYCGTAACAVGLACVLPELREEGLRFHNNSPTPKFERWLAWDAVQMFFDLSAREADLLFGTTSYHPKHRTNPIAVADRIDELLTKRGYHAEMSEV